MLTIEAFTADVPKFHNWDGVWSTGGFKGADLQRLHDLTRAQAQGAELRVLETGAGASTVAFLLAGATTVFSIAPNADLFERIRKFCRDNGIADAPLESTVNISELALPPLARKQHVAGLQVDLALIDGGHGWPTVFVDFCYANAMLRKGGLLLIDDIQLHSVKELARLLREEPSFAQEGNLTPKTLIFRKKTKARFLGDFGGQSYIQRRTQQDADANRAYKLD